MPLSIDQRPYWPTINWPKIHTFCQQHCMDLTASATLLLTEFKPIWFFSSTIFYLPWSFSIYLGVNYFYIQQFLTILPIVIKFEDTTFYLKYRHHQSIIKPVSQFFVWARSSWQESDESEFLVKLFDCNKRLSLRVLVLLIYLFSPRYGCCGRQKLYKKDILAKNVCVCVFF